VSKKYFAAIQPHILCKKGDIAKVVLLPGDPKRVGKIAALFDSYKEVADNREFLTCSGEIYGRKVSVTSTGIGCPSAAIAVEELANIGAESFIRVGTTGAIQDFIDIGDVIIADSAVRSEGTTLEYVPEEYPAVASIEVTSALIKSAQELDIKYHVGTVRTTDSFYAERVQETVQRYRAMSVLGFEMECSAIFTISRLKGLQAGAVLAVTGNLITGKHSYQGDEPDIAEKAIANAIKVAVGAVKYLG
jgi:uridine phosphorylase